MTSPPPYEGFLGTWILLPDTCDYEQGEPPTAGTYTISEGAGRLDFSIDWTDADGASHHAEFGGPPDGSRVPFDGGELADALSIHAVSPRELTSSAYWKGDELMVAQRQLDDTGGAMRVTQVVRFPGGTSLANISVYRKRVVN
jgi:hypothetical protein